MPAARLTLGCVSPCAPFSASRPSAASRIRPRTSILVSLPRLGRNTKDPWSGAQPVPEAVDGVVVHHADGLHEGVADGGAGELEAAPEQVAAQRVGLAVRAGTWPTRRRFTRGLPPTKRHT